MDNRPLIQQIDSDILVEAEDYAELSKQEKRQWVIQTDTSCSGGKYIFINPDTMSHAY